MVSSVGEEGSSETGSLFGSFGDSIASGSPDSRIRGFRPEWQEDNLVTFCGICKREFGLLTRKVLCFTYILLTH